MPSFRQRTQKPKPSLKRTFVRRKSTDGTAADKKKPQQSSTPGPQTQPKVPEPDLIPEVNEIEREIETQAKRLQQTIDQATPPTQIAPVIVDTPQKFDGLGSGDEQLQLLQAELTNEQKKSAMMAHQITLLQQEFSKERESFEAKVRELKRDLHRSQPLHEHTFFTLSKELKESMSIMNQLVVDQGANQAPLATDMAQAQPPSLPPMPVQASQTVNNDVTEATADKREVTKEPTKPNEDLKSEKKPSSKKKTLLTGGAIVAVVVLVGGVIGGQFFMKPKVNDTLVKEYLSNSGQVAGSSDQVTPMPTNTQTDLSQTDIPLDQTAWTKLNEPIMGVSFDYPQNVVKINKTDSSITLIRKDGYIFKIQKINTGLKLEEYWQQIKPTNPNYTEEMTDYNGHKALALTLQEMTPFPGDRYLVKIGEAVFDVWYATPSDSYTKDDLTRVKRILDSVTFKNPDEL